ncbi:endopeptidase La [Clostridium sp. NSJ-49]|uniref:endopeptidase La n=1 Tax=Clostridium TaxID=1485 RepID=UPI00164C13B3|nr:endopeptidase La [Clostridium sp. NSJ-49]MBC5626475.1 endopeptidase La [Clostridium sp. NSJ-49]
MERSQITLAVIPLRGITIFPNMIIHFDVGREKSIAALEEAMKENGEIFLVSQVDPEIENPTKDDVYFIGTISKVKQILKMPKGITRVLVEGIERAEIVDILDEEKFMKANIVKIENEYVKGDDAKESAYRNLLTKSFNQYIEAADVEGNKVPLAITKEESLSKVTDLVASFIELEDDKKQEILETLDVYERIEKLILYITEEIEIINIEKEIGNKVKDKVDKANKEYFLREQVKVIQEELGEDEEKNEIENYKEKIAKLKMPKDVKEKVEYELSRLKTSNSGDGNNIRTYLDWIIALPWNKSTRDTFNIEKAEEVLNAEHYGLDEVKERILEYLAIKQYTKSIKGPILCLVGPPGVGKSSIAKSVANAVNRKFARISLGGVKDEAEVRGHRRTYIGAIPGRIVYALKEAGSNNPLILLDEIDKLSSDHKGSPADALLEVLDPNQNMNFRDSFMEVDIDLSNVLFITTANSLDTIPRPLLDRMEIIEISGYTYEEKFNIAKNHLIPKTLKEHNLDKDTIKISDNVIKEIVNSYTMESGVRTLERQINKIVRKAITDLIKNNNKSITISANKVEKYLGPKIFEYEKIDREDKVGVVTGLAWTAYGGDTLPVEVSVMKGSGKLDLTGQLGDVMKESAKASYSYVRANAKKYGIPEDFYKENDIHIHVPEGAVPKDGPSAGVTMTTALVSALSNKKVKSNVAMTGEITLTGRVLAIGGVKEKCLAAHRIGIDTIILPKENEKHVDKIPKSVKSKLNLVFADRIDKVLENALIGVENNDN